MANTMRSGAGRRRGFTLIELMVVVSIVAILAAIALPSYRAQIAKSRRAEARAQLTEVAQYMQRYYSQNDRYDQSNAATPVALALPDLLTRVPKGAASGAQNYTISFVTNSLTANAYTLQAVPRTGGLMAGDRCGTLSITHLGRRATSAGTTADWIKECWS